MVRSRAGVLAVVFLLLLTMTVGVQLAYVSAMQPVEQDDDGFKQVNRAGSVDLDAEYDLSGLRIPRDQIHTLLPRDAIPALTDPEMIPIREADWLNDDDRIIEVSINGNSVAVPIKILNFHEIANITVGCEPVAATYCPLCDSVTVVRRTIKISTPKDATETGVDSPVDTLEVVLEFGVSGALYNSNVLMYDREHLGLWSQLGLKAVSGPFVGTQLELLPVQMLTWSAYKGKHLASIIEPKKFDTKADTDSPGPRVLSIKTGHDRTYDGNPYKGYFERDDYIMVPIADHGDQLPKKTLGLGIRAGDEQFFVPLSAIDDRFVVKTQVGEVIASATPAGVRVLSAPQQVQTVQSFYYSFSAFHPQAKVVTESAE